MTIHVTQVEIDVAKLVEAQNEVSYFNCYTNPVALALNKVFKTKCAAYSDTLYVGKPFGLSSPYSVECSLRTYPTLGMKPFSFDIQDL